MQLTQLEHSARILCGLDPQLVTLVGVSGGADSLCLAEGLHQLGFKLLVAHFDHGLRPESAQDARQVAEFAALRGLAFVTERGQVDEVAQRQHLSVEEAARLARYAFLFAAAHQVGAQAVAVAHTADDQVETVLMHLLRGAALAGLKGMLYRTVVPQWDAHLPVVRPMLDVWRSEVEAYCAEHGLHPVTDATNADTTFFRNRLRHELIPYLAQYNPQIKAQLWRTSQILADDYAYLDDQVAQAFTQALINQGAGYVALNRTALLALPLPLLRGVVRRAVNTLRPGLRDVDFEAVERAVVFIRIPASTGQVDWLGGLRWVSEPPAVILAEPGADWSGEAYPQISGRHILTLPGVVELDNGWRIEADAPCTPPEDVMGDDRQAWLDFACLTDPLEVRQALPGERMAPLGLEGKTQKLSDLFINAHVPRRVRAAYPLVCYGGQVAWVPGLRMAEGFKVTPGTQQVVHLQLKMPE